MTSGGRDFKRALRPFLPRDFRKIGNPFEFFERSARLFGGNGTIGELGEFRSGTLFKNVQRFAEIGRRVRPDSGNPRGFGRVARGYEDFADARFDERGRMRHDASDFPERSVERELAEYGDRVQFGFADPAFFREDADGDRQVERRSRLAEFRRGEVYRDPLLGKGESRVPDRRTHPFAAFLDGGVAEPHHGERGKPGGHVGFDRYRMSRNSPNRRRENGFDHKKSAENDIFALPETIIPKSRHS